MRLRQSPGADFRREPKAPPAEWASAADRTLRYKPRPTMLVQRSSHQKIWWRSIYHRYQCSGPHWPTNAKRAQLRKQRRSVIAWLGTEVPAAQGVVVLKAHFANPLARRGRCFRAATAARAGHVTRFETGQRCK